MRNFIRGGIKDLKQQQKYREKLKTLSISERRKYGIPSSDSGIDLMDVVLLSSVVSALSEDNHSSFSGLGGDFGGGGASGSWDSDSSSSSSSYDSGSSDCGGGCDCGGGGGD